MSSASRVATTTQELWTLKVDLNGDLRRLKHWTVNQEEPSIESAHDAICQLFGLASADVKSLVLAYKGNDGDLCTLTAGNLADAMALAGEMHMLRLVASWPRPVEFVESTALQHADAPDAADPHPQDSFVAGAPAALEALWLPTDTVHVADMPATTPMLTGDVPTAAEATAPKNCVAEPNAQPTAQDLLYGLRTEIEMLQGRLHHGCDQLQDSVKPKLDKLQEKIDKLRLSLRFGRIQLRENVQKDMDSLQTELVKLRTRFWDHVERFHVAGSNVESASMVTATAMAVGAAALTMSRVAPLPVRLLGIGVATAAVVGVPCAASARGSGAVDSAEAADPQVSHTQEMSSAVEVTVVHGQAQAEAAKEVGLGQLGAIADGQASTDTPGAAILLTQTNA